MIVRVSADTMFGLIYGIGLGFFVAVALIRNGMLEVSDLIPLGGMFLLISFAVRRLLKRNKEEALGVTRSDMGKGG